MPGIAWWPLNLTGVEELVLCIWPFYNRSSGKFFIHFLYFVNKYIFYFSESLNNTFVIHFVTKKIRVLIQFSFIFDYFRFSATCGRNVLRLPTSSGRIFRLILKIIVMSIPFSGLLITNQSNILAIVVIPAQSGNEFSTNNWTY